MAVKLWGGDVVRALPCAESKHNEAVGSCVGGEVEGVGPFGGHGVVVPREREAIMADEGVVPLDAAETEGEDAVAAEGGAEGVGVETGTLAGCSVPEVGLTKQEGVGLGYVVARQKGEVQMCDGRASGLGFRVGIVARDGIGGVAEEEGVGRA